MRTKNDRRGLRLAMMTGGVMALIVMAIVWQNVCLTTWFRVGIALRQCPDGALRQTLTLSASGLRRGGAGNVSISAVAHYTVAAADESQSKMFGRFTPAVALVDQGGKEFPLAPIEPWHEGDAYQSANVTLPEVPDGDYILRARVSSRIGKDTVDVALPLYTPARVHVITDRPLYEPGHLVQFRAVVLRARDLAPLDSRPGRWMVRDPNGEVLLEEKAPAGEWGVVAGSFPLDKGAPLGTWRVAWVSGDAKDEVSFTVKPFTLPRFRIEASADKPFYQRNDTPKVKGAVIYSSGAPVAAAKVELRWNVSGDWPPPADWLDKRLPKQLTADATGRFELTLPAVPVDLVGQATLSARVSAIDAAGDRVEGSVSLLLSEDRLLVSTVTELSDGLVEGFNNRLYLRVTTADGQAIPGTKIRVKRAWMPQDPGIEAQLDEDSVGSLQIDPGPAVNVVLPITPVRVVAKNDSAVSRGQVNELIGGEGAPLADQLAMDGSIKPLAACARYVDGGNEAVKLVLRVDAGGAIVEGYTEEKKALATCALDVARRGRLSKGSERLYTVTFDFSSPPGPKLSASVESTIDAPEGLEERVSELAKGARDCLSRKAEGNLPKLLIWRVRAHSKDVTTSWLRDPQGTANAAMGCIEGRVGKQLRLEKEAEADRIGLARFMASPAAEVRESRPQAQTMLGYEFAVTAEAAEPSSTKLRMRPGSVPPLRLRATPVLAKPGEVVTVEAIRGPSFQGSLPEEVTLAHLKGRKTVKLDRDKRSAQFTIEPGTAGFCEITAGSVRALVYVRPEQDLHVSLSPDQERYAPGANANIRIKTTLGQSGGKAAVGLIGVDESLAQLTTLPGPDDLGRVRPKVEMSAPAFGVIDGQALLLGRIRGVNAAAATILRVNSVPTAAVLDAVVSVSGESSFDAIGQLTDHFYLALGELRAQTRAWEAKAPPSDRMRAAKLAELWNESLAALEKRGQRVDDAFGRRLKLHRLPPDLLGLTDPRTVVTVGTRLPEDVENWPDWVRTVRP